MSSSVMAGTRYQIQRTRDNDDVLVDGHVGAVIKRELETVTERVTATVDCKLPGTRDSGA